jgi:ribose 1,5-bisphosphokinase
MGPSGSGKDSLLSALRQREHSQLLVAHRYITRAANAGSENHIALSEQEFFTRAGQNLLALSWHANGFYYGVGIEIDLWLHAGFDVLVNGSRAHLPQAKARYEAALLPICLQVSPDVLRSRGCKTGGAKTRVRLTSGWSARRATPLQAAMSSITTEVCYSQSRFLSLIRQKEKQHA